MSSPYIHTTEVADSIPFDNSSNGFTATNVQDAIEEAEISTPVNYIATSAGVTRNSSTDATMGGMTYTNSSGASIKVVALFNGDITIGKTGAVLSISFYLNGGQVANTLRKQSSDGGTLSGSCRVTASTQCKVIIPNGQTLDVRWSVSSGTITGGARSIILTKCGDF